MARRPRDTEAGVDKMASADSADSADSVDRMDPGDITASRPRPDVATLRDRAVALAAAGRRAIVGIAGPPGAGKSTLAQAVVAAIDELRPGTSAYVPMDGFHLADVQLARLGLLDRKGAPETFDDVGYAVLVERLHADAQEIVYAPGFDRLLEQPVAASVAVSPAARVVVTEGNYLLLPSGAWPRVRAALDEGWYCHAEDATRVERLVARHTQFGKAADAARAWVLRTDEANAAVVATTRAAADLVVEM